MMNSWRLITDVLQENLETIESILLKNRGVTTEKEKSAFLNPPHPNDLTCEDVGLEKKSVDEAIQRINKAKKNNESVIIYTDYDVDGVCGGTILWEGLYKVGLKVLPYVPDRVTEGYGLSIKGIDNVKKLHDPTLIITIDNGIRAEKEIKYAKKLGIDVIVLDHHTKGEKLDAIVVHTTTLCAAGIAWFFIREISGEKIKENKNLDIASLATIADCVKLIGPNRSVVKYGLEELRKTNRIGLNALIKQAGIEKEKIGVFEVGFMIAPRINAMGRIASALDSLRLLCTKDQRKAENLASLLAKTNRERQSITEGSLKEVLESLGDIENEKIIFVHGEYNQGIIGLLAGKLVEKYQKPTIVISDSELYCKGSMRSVPGINITEFIQEFTELLVNSGGHPMAGGFTIEKQKIPELKKAIEKKAKDIIQDGVLKKELLIDCPIGIDIVNEDFINILKKLSPFGIGNPEPIFQSKNLKIAGSRKIGKEGKHLKMQVSYKRGMLDAIGFGLGEKHEELKDEMHAVFKVEENFWNGRRSLQLNIKDVIILKSFEKGVDGADTPEPREESGSN